MISIRFRLYNRPKNIILGGTQLLSERVEMYSLIRGLNRYKKAKGIEV